jgi:hypothetical protein
MTAAESPERVLSKELAAARALRESIAAVIGDDAETMRDTIEGETGLHEAIASVIALMREDEILMLGLSEMLTAMEARRHRLEERAKRCRAAIEQAMSIGELTRLDLPDVSLTLKRVPPNLEITDEAKVPAEFWKAQDPKLDKSALKAALKEGRAVEGATLGNGGIAVQIRRS